MLDQDRTSQDPPPFYIGFGSGVRHGFNSSRSILNYEPLPTLPAPETSATFGPGSFNIWHPVQTAPDTTDLATPNLVSFHEDIFRAPAPPSTPFDILMASPPAPRRASSAASNATIRAAELQQHAQTALGLSIVPNGNDNNHPTNGTGIATPNISPTNTNTRELLLPRVAHPSISSISMSSITSRSSTTSHAQSRFFSVLQEICTEAARRRWHSEIQRRLVDNLAARHRPVVPRDLGNTFGARSTIVNIQGQGSQHRLSGWHRRSPAYRDRVRRYNPYRAAPRVSEQEIEAARSWTLFDYLSSIANMTWSSAHTRLVERHAAEVLAVEEMQGLYRLGSSVVRAAEAAGQGETYSVEELRDIVGYGGNLCRVLGYAEGWDRCEEMGRDWSVWEDGGIW